MGEALAYRALQAGHEVFGFDLNADNCATAAQSGVRIVNAIEDFEHHDIHIYWLLVSQGKIVDTVIRQLQPMLQDGAISTDGTNSKLTDSMAHAQALEFHNI